MRQHINSINTAPSTEQILKQYKLLQGGEVKMKDHKEIRMGGIPRNVMEIWGGIKEEN